MRVGKIDSKQFFMKKFNLSFFTTLFIFSNVFAQNTTSIDSSKLFDVNKIESYVFGTDLEGLEISLDDNNDLVFVKMIQNIKLSKDDIYNRALSFFITNYKDAKSVIQQQDKADGIIIGKGIFSDFHCSKRANKLYGVDVVSMDYYSAYHIMRIDIKEERARIIISVNNYDFQTSVGASNLLGSSFSKGNPISVKIVDCPPIDTTPTEELIEKEVSKASSYKKAVRKSMKEIMPDVLESKKAAFVPLCKKAYESITNLEKALKNQSSKTSENW